jgi:hypothetical protein
MTIDLLEPNKSSAEQFADEDLDGDLDDDSLLEAHDSLVSVLVKELPPVAQPPLVPAAPIALPPSVALNPPKSLVQKGITDFIRTHGPINRAIEALLDKLSEPLIELLSHDMSLKASKWDPPHGLLHKLNPIGVPPHRLRVKVGCVVSLLRDLNSSSQLSKS